MAMINETQSGVPSDGAVSDGAWRAFGLLRFRGPDAVKFLQGQLSNDMKLLDARQFMLAGLHNPQGRVLALLRLLAPEPDHIIALLPAELAATTLATLSRYVLRAKVTLSNESNQEALDALAARIPAAAQLLRSTAHALDIAAGLPQVYAATSGEFVAQMLNLDCVGAISFNKGCYTGQEIIARAHYRGRMKRRMQRFVTAAPATLAPGNTLSLSDGRTAQIVDATVLADGRSEFLAVTPLIAGAAADPQGAAPELGPAATAQAAQAAPLACSPLPLPYALPA